MKTGKLNKFAWTFFVLALTTTTLFAQGRGNNRNAAGNLSCVQHITGLSETQQAQITGLNRQHQQEMAALRDQRRSTTDAAQKAQVRTEMDQQQQTHRESVRKLLNASQQAQFDQLMPRGGQGKNRQAVTGNQGRYAQGAGCMRAAGGNGQSGRGGRR